VTESRGCGELTRVLLSNVNLKFGEVLRRLIPEFRAASGGGCSEGECSERSSYDGTLKQHGTRCRGEKETKGKEINLGRRSSPPRPHLTSFSAVKLLRGMTEASCAVSTVSRRLGRSAGS
jgi:hypothetical protein